MKSDDNDNDRDKVGYGKPPKHSQFKPGQSGNRAGRPKGKRAFLDDLLAELSEIVSITENGRTQRVTKQRAVMKSAFAKASKGDFRALNFLLQRIPLLEEAQEAREQEQFWRRQNTFRIIEKARERMAKSLQQKEVEIDGGQAGSVDLP